MRKNIATYKNINRESGLNVADPHTIISMMFDGLYESLSVTKGAIERNDLEVKSKQLNKGMSILRSLQYSLDTDAEPKISANFYELYAYCIDRLIDVSTTQDCSIIDDVVNLLKPLSDAWKNISENDKQAGFELLKSKKIAS